MSPLLIYYNLSTTPPLFYVNHHPYSLKPESYHPPSPWVVRQDDNNKYLDLEGESKEDPSESNMKIDLDPESDYDSD